MSLLGEITSKPGRPTSLSTYLDDPFFVELWDHHHHDENGEIVTFSNCIAGSKSGLERFGPKNASNFMLMFEQISLGSWRKVGNATRRKRDQEGRLLIKRD